RASVCSDAVIRWFGGQLYGIERFGCDNIRILDPTTFSVVRQFSVGNGSNPNDIYVVSPTKAYVTRYDKADLWIVNPSTGAFVNSISLAPFADHDGLPEMNRLAYHAGRLFVSCQRLDRDNSFLPTDSSLVVVIDTQTDQFVDADPIAPGIQGILLPRTNPSTEFATTPEGNFLLGCTGAYGVADGGVVRLDPRTLTSSIVEVTEAQLGGDVNDVAVGPGASGAARAFCVVSDAAFNTNLVSYQRAGAPSVATVFPGSGFVLGDVEVNDRDEVWLCDRTGTGPGIRVFSAVTNAPLTVGPIATGLPPSDVAFDVVEPVGVADLPAAGVATGGIGFASIAPNPAAGGSATTIRLRAEAAGMLEVAIRNAAGRAVRSWRLEIEAGERSLAWDGRDEAGQAAPAGVYLVRASLSGHAGAASARLVRLAPTRL
ncbi:MAG: FlgD immunoglobulin-like domain containing protein, partial [Candidatus Eisenbacteria bacterium]